MRTWHLEALVMGAVLVVVGIVDDPADWVVWVGVAAVWVTSRHMSCGDRLKEKEQLGLDRPVDCVTWLDRYWLGKEALWLVYFVALEAWPALGGVALFTLYPVWRRWYRSRYPADRHD